MSYLKYVLDIKAVTTSKYKDTPQPVWIEVSPIDSFSIAIDDNGEQFISGRIGGRFSFAPDIDPFEEKPSDEIPHFHDSSYLLFSVYGTDTVCWFLNEMDHHTIIDTTQFDPEKICVLDHNGKPISKKLC